MPVSVCCIVVHYISIYIALACSLELVRCTLKILSPPDNRQHRQNATLNVDFVYGFASSFLCALVDALTRSGTLNLIGPGRQEVYGERD